MRVLMLSTPVPTHFTPLVPLAWALRVAGHEVLIAVQPDVLPAVEAAGLVGVSAGVGFHYEERQGAELDPGQRPLERHGRAALEDGSPGFVFATHSRYLWKEYLDIARAFGPDIVMSDALEFTALMVGGALDVPVVQQRWGVDPWSATAHQQASAMLLGPCRRLGLEGLPEPTALLDPCPPSLQLPEAASGLPMRFVPYNGPGRQPPWAHRPAFAGTRPHRVLVTLGGRTLELNGVPFVRKFLQAFGEMPGTEVFATVAARHRKQIGPLPDTVRLVDPAPLNLVLDNCDAVVHHGGAGTAMTVTAYGVPQLILPQLADQFAHGDRLAAAGAALAFDTAEQQNDPECLTDALGTLLSAPRYAKAAAELRREMRDMPPLGQVCDELAANLANRRNARAVPR
ncbi:nucleotide disphospho-sugar-binding domain-containing protein [Streptomyces sp. NPDC055189]